MSSIVPEPVEADQSIKHNGVGLVVSSTPAQLPADPTVVLDLDLLFSPPDNPSAVPVTAGSFDPNKLMMISFLVGIASVHQSEVVFTLYSFYFLDCLLIGIFSFSFLKQDESDADEDKKNIPTDAHFDTR